MTFQRLNQFHTADPKLLDRELNSLEDNITRETADLRSSFIPVVQPVKFVVRSTTQAIFQAKFGQWISAECIIASGTIVLPPVDARNVGKRIYIFLAPTVNNLFLACQVKTDTINTLTTPQTLGNFLTQVFLDYSGYWFV